jgi:hypothetical protein
MERSGKSITSQSLPALTVIDVIPFVIDRSMSYLVVVVANLTAHGAGLTVALSHSHDGAGLPALAEAPGRSIQELLPAYKTTFS